MTKTCCAWRERAGRADPDVRLPLGCTRTADSFAVVVDRTLMPVNRKYLGWLLAQAVADLPETREEAAATSVDWETSMTDVQKRLSRQGAVVDGDGRGIKERPQAQLNAISHLFLPPFMTKADVAPLVEIPVATLDAQDVHHLDGLEEALADFSHRVELEQPLAPRP